MSALEHSPSNRAGGPVWDGYDPQLGSRFNAIAIARVCHEANRTLQVLLDEAGVSPHWDEAPAWQTQSAVDGVLEALRGATPEQLHDAWVDAKLDAGWRYGPVKDAVALRHPCLVPYDQLPAEQRAKDTLFHAIVGALR